MSHSNKYDVIVIGAGPAGYIASIRSAQLGLKTACIDNWCKADGSGSLGGTYINAGCISSMALLESSKIVHLLNHEIGRHGIKVSDTSFDMVQMIKRKDDTIKTLSQQIRDIFTQHQVDYIHAHGKLLNAKEVLVSTIENNEESTLHADNIILATGSTPIDLSCAPIDNEYILDSSTALNLTTVPKKLGIIGAGVIGLELGGIWSRLGSEVVILEAQDSFLTTTDHQISAEAFRIYKQQGLDIRLSARVINTETNNDQVIVEYRDLDGTHSLKLDKLIVASGRKPNTDNLAAPEANLLLDENGCVHVDKNCNTNLPGVFAIGDLTILGPMLAHKGLEEGVFVAEQIAGCHTPINYNIIPSVVYTDPEIAWVGQTEQALNAIGEQIKIGCYPFKATGRGQATGKTEGLVKIIAHAETDTILGIHIIGINASELIAEAVLAMEFSATAEDLARTIHAHPTSSESIHEAALALNERSLHLPIKSE